MLKWTILFLALGGCGYQEAVVFTPPRYHCDGPFRDIGSDHQLDCVILRNNFELAYSEFPWYFDEVPVRYINRVFIWDEESRDCGGFQCWGWTNVNSHLIELDHMTFSLGHEFGHVYRYWKYGDADPGHLHWDEIDDSGRSQRMRDIHYQDNYEPLP